MEKITLKLKPEEFDELNNALEEALAVVSVISSLDFDSSSDIFEEGYINRLAQNAKALIERALNILNSDST